MKHISLSIYLIFAFIGLFAQSKDSSFIQDGPFINDLLNNREYKLIKTYLRPYQQDKGLLSDKYLDSMNFILGWVYYSEKEMDSSIHYFSMVSEESGSYYKARFYKELEHLYLGNYMRALDEMLSFNSKNQLFAGLSHVQLAGLGLLTRDFDLYHSNILEIPDNYYALNQAKGKLEAQYAQMRSFKHKSMFISGFLSAMVPGLGKVYCGKYTEGLSAFILSGITGAIAYENISKRGIYDIGSIFFTGLFATYYIGNIWGSVFSVRIRENEYFEHKTEEILLDLHIPLRTIFY